MLARLLSSWFGGKCLVVWEIDLGLFGFFKMLVLLFSFGGGGLWGEKERMGNRGMLTIPISLKR